MAALGRWDVYCSGCSGCAERMRQVLQRAVEKPAEAETIGGFVRVTVEEDS
jgi:hypothetical protein